MMKLFVCIFALVAVAATHYEKPPCDPTEQAIQIMGVTGVFCSPACAVDETCPTDAPPGVTASPTCALQSPTGEMYCALLCTPSTSASVRGSFTDGQCGYEMSCEPVPQSQGFGICVYPMSKIEGSIEPLTVVIDEDDLDPIASTK